MVGLYNASRHTSFDVVLNNIVGGKKLGTNDIKKHPNCQLKDDIKVAGLIN